MAVVAALCAAGVLAAMALVVPTALGHGSPAPSATATAPARTPSPSGAGPSASASPDASSLYLRGLSLARAQPGFAYTGTLLEGGVAVTLQGTADPLDGSQTVGADGFQASLILLHGTVYLRTGGTLLQAILDVPRALAAELQDRWISFSPGDSPYSRLEPGLSGADLLGAVELIPSTALAYQRSDGSTVERIEGTLPDPGGTVTGSAATLDLSPSTGLPVDYSAGGVVGGTSASLTLDFTSWGPPPSVPTPPGAVPWSSLGIPASPAPSGGGAAAPIGSLLI